MINISFLGARIDSRRNRGVFEGLLGRRSGSLWPLSGSLEAVLSGDGVPAPEGAEGGPRGETADYEEQEEDIPPSYDQVVGPGPGLLCYGPTEV